MSLEGCQRLCRAESSCVGVEHHEGVDTGREKERYMRYLIAKIYKKYVTPQKNIVDGALDILNHDCKYSQNIYTYIIYIYAINYYIF